MINLIIFDLDGVLVDTKKNHYIALNEALKKFGIKKTISYEDHLRKFDGFIALGCVIKGETPHFNFICNSTFDAILKISIDYNKPIGNGIITALNMSQAVNRSKKNSLKKSNKGSEAVNAVLSILKNEPKKI